jgi:small nuclear ribonucleoprotein B and B'
MNMVLGDAEEYRRIKSKNRQGLVEDREEKRSLGLIILRGDSIVSMVILFLFYFILFYFIFPLN